MNCKESTHRPDRAGNQSFSIHLAALLPKEAVKLSSPVKKITQLDNFCKVETIDGTVFKSRKVIISLPTALYDSISFEPPLPAEKEALSKVTALGYYAKTILVFDSRERHRDGMGQRAVVPRRAEPGHAPRNLNQ